MNQDFISNEQKDYERNLREIQRQHLSNVGRINNSKVPWRPCMHDQCSECHGTGVKTNGGMCVHGISCPCPKCSTTC